MADGSDINHRQDIVLLQETDWKDTFHIRWTEKVTPGFSLHFLYDQLSSHRGNFRAVWILCSPNLNFFLSFSNFRFFISFDVFFPGALSSYNIPNVEVQSHLFLLQREAESICPTYKLHS